MHICTSTVNDPDGVVFPFDPQLLVSADAWILATRLGDLDLVFHPAGSRGFPDLIKEPPSCRSPSIGN